MFFYSLRSHSAPRTKSNNVYIGDTGVPGTLCVCVMCRRCLPHSSPAVTAHARPALELFAELFKFSPVEAKGKRKAHFWSDIAGASSGSALNGDSGGLAAGDGAAAGSAGGADGGPAAKAAKAGADLSVGSRWETPVRTSLLPPPFSQPFLLLSGGVGRSSGRLRGHVRGELPLCGAASHQPADGADRRAHHRRRHHGNNNQPPLSTTVATTVAATAINRHQCRP